MSEQIRLSAENWMWLNSMKEPGDSFNDVLDRLRARHEGEPLTPTINTEETVEALPDELDLPGSGDTLDRRRITIARLYDYLRQNGTATKDEFLELVDADDLGYASRESFWSNAIKGQDTLRALPGVEPPGHGERTWRYTG